MRLSLYKCNIKRPGNYNIMKWSAYETVAVVEERVSNQLLHSYLELHRQ